MPLEDFEFTEYFETKVLKKRPYLKKKWCVFVVENAEKSESQEHNRYRYWARVAEFDNRYLRVVTLEDRSQYIMHSPIEDTKHEGQIL